MERLKRLADELTVVRGALGNIGRSWSAEAMKVVEQAETILRSAAAETVGTEWNDDPKRFPFPQSSRVRHNADLQAARLAVAAARKERDEAIKLAYHYPPSDPYNPDGVTWRQMYEMLDEKSLGEKHGHACAVATLAEERAALQRAIDEAVAAVQFLSDGTARTVTQILRPHATQREGTKAERKWSSTPPQDRGGKWWNAWKNTDGSHGKWLVPLNIDWRDALDQRGTAYDLWLPYLDGDTRDNLPPLPNSSATLTGSPTPATAEAKAERDAALAKVAELEAKLGSIRAARESAIDIARRAEAERAEQVKPSAEAKAAAWCNESPHKRPARRKGER